MGKGIPIWVLLFILATEMFPINVRSDISIKAITVTEKKSSKIAQLADDTTLDKPTLSEYLQPFVHEIFYFRPSCHFCWSGSEDIAFS